MTGIFHLVESQDGGPEHIHSIILTEEEARESLAADLALHLFGGWRIDPVYDTTGLLAAVRLTHPRGTERVITFREFDQPVPGAVYPHEC